MSDWDDDGEYGQPITCELCKKLLGYAPYHRDEYRCVTCNEVKDE